MHVVIFEVWPKAGHEQEYFDLAAALKPELVEVDGFISVERFSSLTEPGKILSVSFWRDEDSIKAWRETFHHRQAQAEGRSSLFRDYRIRIAAVQRDYGLNDRKEAPQAPPDSLDPVTP